MPVAIVSGSGGLIGSESVKHLVHKGFDVIGLENDMRVYGDRPNVVPLVQTPTRLELPADHEYHGGIPTSMSNVSMLEAIAKCEAIAGRELHDELSDQTRMGDHRWWVSDMGEFERDYPEFELEYGIDEVLAEIYAANVEQWAR